MSVEERTGTCVICMVRNPLPDLEPVCGPCRSRVRNQLREIPDLCAVLAAGSRPELEAGPVRHLVDVENLVAEDGTIRTTVHEHDARDVNVYAGPIAGLPTGPRVAGSGEAPIPISPDRHDLLAPARRKTSATRELAYPEQDDDQIGHLSAATILDGWCRDFAEGRRESPPAPVVTVQCRYLGDRLEWCFAEHPAVDEFAQDVNDLWHALRGAAGLTRPKPELCEGVPCKSIDCDMKSLYRVPGSDYVECFSCDRLYTASEYTEWVALVAAAARQRGKNVRGAA